MGEDMSDHPAIRKTPGEIRSVAVIGTGSVGAGWAALFLAHGLEVVAFDPAPGADERAFEMVTEAWPSLRALGCTDREVAPLHLMHFARSAAEAAQAADVVQESVSERPALKAAVLAEIDGAAGPEKIILSSTGGITPTEMQRSCRHPERLVVMHPFNPAHLVPLVEVVGGEATEAAVVDWAMAFARRLGKLPIGLAGEAAGHLTNRLQFALLREAVACLLQGVASASDIDAAVRHGLAPRWALMGGLLTLHLAGGGGGTRGILAHAGGAIQKWWAPGETPVLTPQVIDRLCAAGDEVARGHTAAEWIRWRDAGLVQVLQLQQAMDATAPAVRQHKEIEK
jgi:carnitine 3-dehydrogenase